MHAACWDDYDIGTTIAYGPTEQAAMVDLITQYDLPECP